MTNSSKAWPDTQYDGNAEGYEEYDTDREAWLVDKGYGEWMMEQIDPLAPFLVSKGTIA